MQHLILSIIAPPASLIFKLITPLILLSTLLLTACNTELAKPEALKNDSLMQVNVSSLDELAIRPNTDFTLYKKIRFLPITLSYSENRRPNSPIFGKEDFQFDDKETSRFNEQIIKAITQQWNEKLGWENLDISTNNSMPDQASSETTLPPKTIDVKISIENFELFVPIKNNQPFRYQSFADETSKFVIHLELQDAQTGKLLLSSKDKRTTGTRLSSNELTPVSSVHYWPDIFREFSSWSRLMSAQIKSL